MDLRDEYLTGSDNVKYSRYIADIASVQYIGQAEDRASDFSDSVTVNRIDWAEHQGAEPEMKQVWPRSRLWALNGRQLRGDKC